MAKPVSSLMVWSESNSPKSCLLLLPGRGGTSTHMMQTYRNMGLDDTLYVSVTPEKMEWYPMPNGASDQENAIAGLQPACEAIDLILQQINKKFGFGLNQIGLVGFSAGAVMALYCSVYLPYKFPVIVSHAGAILDPQLFPKCSEEKLEIPIVLFHNMDDIVFSWEERYKPMRKCLKQKGYRVTTAEKKWGGHGVSVADIVTMSRFVSKHLKCKNRYFGNILSRAFSQFTFG